MSITLESGPSRIADNGTIVWRHFLLLDCTVGAQSRANQFGRLRGVVETTFSHRIANHSRFDWTGDRTGWAQSRTTIRHSVSG